MISKKQILILFLISGEPGVRGIYTLCKFFDRADFPAKMSEHLNVLLDNELIIVFEKFDNGTYKNFQITEYGMSFLKKNFNSLDILNYIETFEEPNFILELTKVYVEKFENSSSKYFF